LRLVEPFKPADYLSCIDVDRTDRIVSELGDEQPPVRRSVNGAECR
jgi:hypothetical protein